MIDFLKVKHTAKQLIIDPRDLFMSLPNRHSPLEYPRDVQTEVWRKWFANRNDRNIVIKMNTGSGKTVVGLIILQSCLNEGFGPAIYVAPNYLIPQIESEANSLGLKITQDEDSLEYLDKKAILGINVQKLFNGKSVFGLREYHNVKIGSIIIDDIHACISDIEEQFSLKIKPEDPAYGKIINIFEESLKSQYHERYHEAIEYRTSSVSCLVPFWDWQRHIEEVREILITELPEDTRKFNYPLLADCLDLCSCYCSAHDITIMPPCVPIEKVKGFANATRRIFMTATLPDDSAFVSTMGFQDDDFSIISPDKADDIGDRLILFPQITSPELKDYDIKKMLCDLAARYNVVVIVPSGRRAAFWEDCAQRIANASNISTVVSELKHGHVGLVVFVNKYEGIDLPNDACRVLAIDGPPILKSSRDIYEDYIDPESPHIWQKITQKIEQGMGRGVRSSNDYSVVVLIQKGLANILIGDEACHFFSQATMAQFMLSKSVWDQLRGATIDDYSGTIEQVLSRDESWTAMSKECLASTGYTTKPVVNPIAIAERRAYNFAVLRNYPGAESVLREAEQNTPRKQDKGLIKNHIAMYCNFINQEAAQKIILSALSDNPSLIKPASGIVFRPSEPLCQNQAGAIIKYCSDAKLDSNKYVLRLGAVLDLLSFEESSSKFESAIRELGCLIGFCSSRPETDTGRGPDNLWDIGDRNFLIIECKNEVQTGPISKRDCNQLNGSMAWFKSAYHMAEIPHPIMIHRSKQIAYDASLDEQTRIITPAKLDLLKCEIEKFCRDVARDDNFTSAEKLSIILRQHHLCREEIYLYFSEKFEAKK